VGWRVLIVCLASGATPMPTLPLNPGYIRYWKQLACHPVVLPCRMQSLVADMFPAFHDPMPSSVVQYPYTRTVNVHNYNSLAQTRYTVLPACTMYIRCVHISLGTLSRKRLEIQTRLQWNTYRKWHMGYHSVRCTMTSYDPDRSKVRSRYVWMQISRIFSAT